MKSFKQITVLDVQRPPCGLRLAESQDALRLTKLLVHCFALCFYNETLEAANFLAEEVYIYLTASRFWLWQGPHGRWWMVESVPRKSHMVESQETERKGTVLPLL